MVAKYKILLVTLISIICIKAENKLFTAHVYDSDTKSPISKVNITVMNSELGTITNEKGICLLVVPENFTDLKIKFSHIAYKDTTIDVAKVNEKYTVYLKPKLIEFDEVEVAAENHQKYYNQNIYNTVNSIDEIKFEARGHNELADLLISDQSINVTEEQNGTTNISVRGSNSDEILILFDGIKINNDFNSIFDFSIIDPSNLERIDIIKGSNSVTNGAISRSATINLIPKVSSDYTIKFNQRIGSYNSGDWRTNISRNFKGLQIFGSVNQGGSTQCYEGKTEYDHIINKKENYLGNINYAFGKKIKHTMGMKYINSSRSYENKIYTENLRNEFELMNACYSLNLKKIGFTKIQYTLKNLLEDRSYRSTYNFLVFDGKNKINNTSHLFNLTQDMKFKSIDARLSYASEVADMNYETLRIDSETQVYSERNPSHRNLQNILTSLQFNNESGLEKFHLENIKYDLCFEIIDDDLQISEKNVIEKKWFESANNLTVNFAGMHGENHFSSYINMGISNSIPTLYQQLNYQINHQFGEEKSALVAEFRKSMEFGFTYHGKMSDKLGFFQLTGAFFRTAYTNKFRSIQLSQSPIKYFDNHSETTIKGIEVSLQLKMLNKRLVADFGAAKYFSPDAMSFSFKADQKVSAGLIGKLGNLYGEIIWFSESDRIGYVLVNTLAEAYLEEVNLDKFNNIDVGLKYNLLVFKQKITFAFSGKNLIKNEETFEGIAIHDQRFYLSCGFEI